MLREHKVRHRNGGNRMKFSLSDINPKFLAANAEALRAQGIDVSGLPLKLPLAAQKVRQGGKPNLTQAMMKMGAEKGLTGNKVKMIVVDEVAHWPEGSNAGVAERLGVPSPAEQMDALMPRYRSKWERDFHIELLTRFSKDQIEFEPITLKLAHRAKYTPDFCVVEMTHGGAVRLVFFEVKGHWREAARVRIKVAARLFPWAQFIAVKKRKKNEGGGWSEEVFRP